MLRVVLLVIALPFALLLGLFASSVVRAMMFDLSFSAIGALLCLLVAMGVAVLPLWPWAPKRARWPLVVVFVVLYGTGIGLRLFATADVASSLSGGLTVGFVGDNDVPDVFRDGQAAAVLADAQKTVQERFGLALRFYPVGRVAGSEEPVRTLVHESEFTGEAEGIWQTLDLRQPITAPMSERAEKWLRMIPLDDYARIAPVPVASYADLYAAMLHAQIEHAAQLNQLGFVNAKSAHWMTMSGWKRYFAQNTQYDVVITNVPVFEDSIEPPYAHVAFATGVVGGFGPLRAPHVPHHSGFGTLVSTFRLLQDTPFAAHQPQSENVAIVGTVLLAHELGHTLLGLRDNYSHVPGCLMYSDGKGDYSQMLASLRANPGMCEKCRADIERGQRHMITMMP